MKQIFQKTFFLTACTGSLIIAASFITAKKPVAPVASSYSINLESRSASASTQRAGSNDYEWTWRLTNTNPGNGSNGTLQNVSHWSIALSPEAEAALLGAYYSYDGINWIALPTEVERDPAIRACTTTDVLKFNVGTSGSQPTYYKAVFSSEFNVNAYSTSWIKTGGGLQGCNLYYFEGIGSSRLD